MKRFRMGHIAILTALIIIGATTNTPAKTVIPSVGIDHYAGTSWRVTEIDGAPLPDGHSAIIIQFGDIAEAHVHQVCYSFSASPKDAGGMQITYVFDEAQCDSLDPLHIATAKIFENFSYIIPENDTQLRLITADNRSLVATPHPYVNALPTSVTGGLITRPIMSTPLTIELDGPEAFQTELENCTYINSAGGRVGHWFEISWGDGTVSNLQSGPDGETCTNIERHTYANPGRYHVDVKISTIGPDDGQWLIYSGEMDVTLL